MGVPLADGHVEPKPKEPKTLFSQVELRELTDTYANKHDVSADKLFNTVKCEAKKVLIDDVVYYDATAQSDHYYKGVREKSWGLAQWHLPSGNDNFDGTDITYEQAINPDYSVDLMAEYFSKGEATRKLWSCYRKIYA